MQKYNADIKFLNKYYQNALEYVKSNSTCLGYANNKMTHSLQVIGAGNHIIKHEKTFKNRSPEFMRCAILAYLFHDIGRFEEIKVIYDKNKQDPKYNLSISPIDHGVIGAEILSKFQQYNDPRIIIPIRHHGHMIKAFYQDEEYNNIKDINLKKEIEEIIFLCRDADKIANLYSLKTQYSKLEETWASSTNQSFINGPFNPYVIECMKAHILYPKSEIKSNADDFSATLSWIFDINYQTSINFCIKHNIVDAIIKIIAKYNDQVDIQKEVANYAKDYLYKAKDKMSAANY